MFSESYRKIPVEGQQAAPMRLVGVGALAAFAVFAGLQYLYGYYFWGKDSFSVGNDDSFITYRYAANLVDHGVLSFNLTDTPPVEGFSNPLYVLLSALAYLAFGIDGTYPAMAALGALCVLVAFLMIHAHCDRLHGPVAANFTLLTLCLFPAFWINATSGLESPMVFLFQVGVWTASIRVLEGGTRRDVVLLALFSALLVLTRTDGFTFPVFAAAVLALKGHLRPAALVLGVCGALFLAIMAIRYQYYGLPMPLPYYVKVSGDLLLRMVYAAREIRGMSAKSGFLIPLAGLVLAAVVALRKGGPAADRRSALVRWADRLRHLPFEVQASAMVLAYYFMIGGDIYRERFLLIVIAMGIFSFWSVAGAWPLRSATAVMAAASAYLLSSFWFDPRLDQVVERPKFDGAVTLGRFLGDAHPGAVLATGTAGKLPYFSRLETIDILGLNDRHIAMTELKGIIPGHGKWDAGYVFERSPDLICDHVYGDGNITYEFTRDVYEPHGYRLVYLVRSREAAGGDVRLVDGLDREAVREMIVGGYQFGCLGAAGLVAVEPSPGGSAG